MIEAGVRRGKNFALMDEAGAGQLLELRAADFARRKLPVIECHRHRCGKQNSRSDGGRRGKSRKRRDFFMN